MSRLDEKLKIMNKSDEKLKIIIKELIDNSNLIDLRSKKALEISLSDEKITLTGCRFKSLHTSKYEKFRKELYTILLGFGLVDLNTSNYVKISYINEELINITYKKANSIDDTKTKLKGNKFLDTDKIRADIESYDEQILHDINRGHWEVKDEKDLVYRNPLKDINKDCVVGIDFGTKSTIVVYQNNNEVILPMIVGGGKIKGDIDKKVYENPTILEFINIENFMNDYKNSNGRPNTKWSDLTISHTANASLLDTASSSDYYAYFNELKQWCVSKNSSINIKDKNNNTYTLNNFLELKEDDFNPIEVYAYYLGLYINNMRNGIFLEYLLSFPVTYEKEVREKIIESFEKGIKKSLPNEVLEDNETMEKFNVKVGASEPSAYAISALTEYGFDPEDNEKIFYGVFDFGGGTTDFDFGIFREANQKGERRYDYAIEHFGAGGDKYLGGENLLHLIAVEVFKDNAQKLREEKINFRNHPECSMFVGGEFLISESQEARLNTRRVMEELRPIWERSEKYQSIVDKGSISTNLYENNGKMTSNFELLVDVNKLEKILKNRIEKGVENFFESLRIAFNNDEINSANDIKIFLAGNSSKSIFVKELFEEYIQKETSSITEALSEEVALTSEIELFEIFPPLGTDEAYDKQEKLGIEINKDNLEKPTGKTGVAFGLIESRSGGSIKVINKDYEEEETRFKYYVGMKKKKMLNPVLTPESNYNEWVELIDAYEEEVEIHFTTSPKASTKKLDIKETTRIKVILDETFEDDDVFVFVRAVSPSEIEYVVAREDMEMLSKVNKVALQ